MVSYQDQDTARRLSLYAGDSVDEGAVTDSVGALKTTSFALLTQAVAAGGLNLYAQRLRALRVMPSPVPWVLAAGLGLLLGGGRLQAASEEKPLIRRHLCPDVVVEAETAITVTATEKALVCDKQPTQPWGRIPRWQKVYFVKRFLEARGFFAPLVNEDPEMIVVQAGKVTLLHEIVIDSSPVPLFPERYWEVYGRPLTSKALDLVEAWALRELALHGYPCARLETKASPEKGLVRIKVVDAKTAKFPPVTAEHIPGLIGGVEKRYYAFHVGQEYNARLVDLSASRLKQSEMVVSTNFSLNCRDDGSVASLMQRHVPGEPRLLSLGIGFASDEYLIVEGSWKNTRVTSLASTIETYARASYRVQQARVSFDWYYAPIVVRHFLRSSLSFVRENELDYDSREVNVKAGPVWQYDTSWAGVDLWTAALYSHIWVPRGEGPRASRTLAFDNQVSLTSHDYEYYAADPRSGYRLGLGLNFAKKGVGSEFSANTYRLEGSYLKNLFELEPPIWILGLRFKFITTDLGEDSTAEAVPSNRRLRLGGSNDLRGFKRKSLPLQGAFTALYLGGEVRVNNTLPFGLQPIVFMDWGRLGDRGFSLTPTSYWSPGLGVHWQSPVGVIRASVAHGFTSEPGQKGVRETGRWQLYISYGEQF